MSYLSQLWLPGEYCPDCGAENVYQSVEGTALVCLTCALRPESVPDVCYPEDHEEPNPNEVSHA